MYNGIGLQTARGSGTNGYVQANRSHYLTSKVAYNSEADIKRAEAELSRKPNPELLEHMKKRQIELKCADFELLMEKKVVVNILLFIVNFNLFVAVVLENGNIRIEQQCWVQPSVSKSLYLFNEDSFFTFI
ncbi:unnamed protein product [Enterobius vermicularis]|uniref:Cwf21 domain-containing protein n=1 Tax=Enterobius vermicularis TaxID=51028 RepID=A0A0N4VQT3_ENTVE|nr:unnamed protein product [Enterobius vermicularis]